MVRECPQNGHFQHLTISIFEWSGTTVHPSPGFAPMKSDVIVVGLMRAIPTFIATLHLRQYGRLIMSVSYKEFIKCQAPVYRDWYSP